MWGCEINYGESWTASTATVLGLLGIDLNKAWTVYDLSTFLKSRENFLNIMKSRGSKKILLSALHSLFLKTRNVFSNFSLWWQSFHNTRQFGTKKKEIQNSIDNFLEICWSYCTHISRHVFPWYLGDQFRNLGDRDIWGTSLESLGRLWQWVVTNHNHNQYKPISSEALLMKNKI